MTACVEQCSAPLPVGNPLVGTIVADRRTMYFALWLIAVVLVIAGIVTAIRGRVIYGIVLIIVGLLVGPGGVSVFHVHRHHHHNAMSVTVGR